MLCPNVIWLLNIPVIFIENVSLGAEDSFGTESKKKSSR